MGSLDTRLKRLEDDGKPCPECGWDGDWSNVKIEVTWPALDRDDEEEVEEEGEYYPEYCPECGRQLVIIVRWLDLEEGE